MNMKGTCSNCGNEARVVRGDYEFKESGLPVILKGIELIKCPACGNEDPVIPKLNQMMRVLALAVISKRYRLQGEDVRFLRKYVKLTGEEFAGLLNIDRTTLSKWETNADPVGDQSDRLIRVIAVGLGKGLKPELERIVRDFPGIKDEFKNVGINVNTDKLEYEYAA